MPELDQYEKEGIASDADVESLSENAANDARLAAERELERRDKREGGELPAAFSGVQPTLLNVFYPRTPVEVYFIVNSDSKTCHCTCFRESWFYKQTDALRKSIAQVFHLICS